MELRHLRYFLAVSEALSFSGAARKLGISQPPLSVQIRALEGELGVQLFTRTSRVVRLTAAGQLFLRDARRIVDHADAARSRLSDGLEGRLGVLRLGFSEVALHGKVLRRLRKFLRRHPSIQVEPVFGSDVQMAQGVQSGELDAAIAHVVAGAEGYQVVLVQQDRVHVVLSRKHPLADQKQLRLESLEGETLLVGTDAVAFPIERLLLDRLAAAGVQMKLRSVGATPWERLWASGLGLGISPCSAAMAEAAPFDLPVRPLDGEGNEVGICLMWSDESTALSLPSLINHLAPPDDLPVEAERTA
jgi:DNA-binding transcriptional LysR family regulator